MANPWLVCPQKHRYATEMEAREQGAFEELMAWHPLNVYQCPRCKGWHLTKRNATGLLLPKEDKG